MTADMLTQGTATRTAPEIAQQIEALGASLETEAGWDATRLQLDTLSENAGAALEIVADVVRNPKFASEEIARERRQALDELRVSMEQPGFVARAVGVRALLADSPYGRPVMGTLASLPRLEREDFVTLHGRTFVPGNAVLIMAGNVTAAEGFALAERSFGDWKGQAPEASPRGEFAKTPRALLVDLPAAGQAAVYVGAPGLARTAEQFVVSEVANAVLGMGYSSRLNQEIRLKRGLSYGAASRLAPSHDFGLFGASCQTKHESVAEVVRVIQGELTRLAGELIPAEYLAARKAVLVGEFSRDLATIKGTVKRLSELALHGLSPETLAHHVERLEAVDADLIRTFAGKHLAPGLMSVIVAGRAEIVEPELRKVLPELQVLPKAALDLDAGGLGLKPRDSK